MKLPARTDVKRMVLPFDIKSFKEDEKYFYFEGYLSTFGNEDRGGDVVVKGAFAESLKAHTPSLLWSHNNSEPLGVFDSLVEDDKGLYVKGRMPKEDDFVLKRIMPQMKIGSIKAMSIGYSIWGEDGMESAAGVWYLKKLFLWEGSLVTIPMNEQAVIKSKSAVPYQENLPIADRSRPWDKVTALGRVREWAGADDGGLEDPEAQAKYKQAFLWYAEQDADIFAAYKLPIADIIEGELTVVPRAIFAAAGALRGARGGVFIPYDDRPRVTRTVERYYEAMGLDSPFEKIFRVDDFRALDERTMEKLFKSGVKMSESKAKTLVSFVKAGLERDGSSSVQRDVEADNEWSDILCSINELGKKLQKD